MIRLLESGVDVCPECGRPRGLLINGYGATGVICWGCPRRQVARPAAPPAPAPAVPLKRLIRRRRVTNAQKHTYRLRECTHCRKAYQPTGPRGTLCPECNPVQLVLVSDAP